MEMNPLRAERAAPHIGRHTIAATPQVRLLQEDSLWPMRRHPSGAIGASLIAVATMSVAAALFPAIG